MTPNPIDQSKKVKRFHLHKWSEWSIPYQTTFSNKLGNKSVGMVQTKVCLICNKMKWRQP